MPKMYNFRTGEYDNVENALQSFADYIPQDEAAQRVYELRIELGATPREAVLAVLRNVLNRFQDNPDNTGK